LSSDTIASSSLAGRYSLALFELAELESSLDHVLADLESIKKLILDSKDLKCVIKSPVIPMSEQREVMRELLDRLDVSTLTASFVGVVIANRRLLALPEMIEEFKSYLFERRGQISAEVTTPKTLSESQIKGIAEAIEKGTKKQVTITEKIDKSLLGGLIVRIGSQMVDNSLRTKLNKLHLIMKGKN
jgi:F-type H+-transporting ATPase subunit delta